ncbi:hypothetical protein TrRE_jg8741, partial [Triparma retinervis]
MDARTLRIELRAADEREGDLIRELKDMAGTRRGERERWEEER